MKLLKLLSSNHDCSDTQQARQCGCSSTRPEAKAPAPFEADPARVLLHPELAEDPAALNWVVTSFPRDLSLAVSHPESPLQKLVAQGVLTDATGATGAVYTVAESQQAWKTIAGDVRRAIEDTVVSAQIALAEGVNPAHDPAADPHLDALLADVAPQVLDRYVRPLAGAHGGKIEITKICGGTVWVNLDGACRGCPAAKFTLHQRFERELARRAPGTLVREAR